MFFKKCESKKKHPVLTLAVGTLASVGAISMITAGKRFVMDKMRDFARMFRWDKKIVEECVNEMTD